MSFTLPDTGPFSIISGIWRSKALGALAYHLGIATSAIAITAGYTIATEEGRGLVARMRSTSMTRKDRNNAVLCALQAADVPLQILQYLDRQRDVFRAAFTISLDQEVPPEVRQQLRDCLQQFYVVSRSA